MVDDVEDSDDNGLGSGELHKRILNNSGVGETVDSPSGDGCWYNDQMFPEGATAMIDEARKICRGGVWLSFEHPSPPYIDTGDDDPFVNDAEPMD